MTLGLSLSRDYQAVNDMLLPCTRYVVGLQNSSIELPHSLRITMAYDPLAPPKNVQIDRTSNDTLEFEWEHSCSLEGEHPDSYVFTARNLATNETTTVIVNGTKYRFDGIRPGSEFEINISTTAKGARNHTFWSIPAPQYLTTELKNNGTVVTFKWEYVDYDAKEYKYAS